MSVAEHGFETRSDGALVKASGMPLRIVQIKGRSTLTCPYELAPSWDIVVINNMDPKIARIGLVDIPFGNYQPFERDIFVSKTSDQTPLTMTGYLYTGPIIVRAWKDQSPPAPKNEDREWREILRKVTAEHVQGYQEALSRHRERIAGMDLIDITPDDTRKIYEAMVYAVPD